MEQENPRIRAISPIKDVDTSIGRLTIYPENLYRHYEVKRVIGKKISECTPQEYISALSSYICLPKGTEYASLTSEEPLLSSEASIRLTAEDFEKIAQAYIDGNEHLFKKYIIKVKNNEAGKANLTRELGEVIFPRNDQETSVQYLHRISAVAEEEEERRDKQFAEKIAGLTGFSKELTESIQNFSALGESLKQSLRIPESLSQMINFQKSFAPSKEFIESMQKTRSMMESMRTPVPDSPFPRFEPKAPRIDLKELAEAQEEHRLRPFKMIDKSLAELKDISEKTIEYHIESNNVQLQIAGELKKSGDDAAKYAKRNIWLNSVVIGLTVLGLIVAFLSFLSGNKESLANGRLADQRSREMVKVLNEINSNLATSSGAEIARLNQLVQAQQRTILKLQKERDREREQINLLEKKMQSFEFKSAEKKE